MLRPLAAKPEGPLPRKEPFGFVARNKTSGDVFVTFRGTQSPEDWMSDLTFPQAAHPWGQTEAGFSTLYAQCSADVRTCVQQAAAQRVFVTGHSLGAGLAVLATADLVQSGAAPAAVMYSFAGPRVGDPAFAAKFNAQVGRAWRIVNTEDIVTTVPLATPTLITDSKPNSVLGMVLMLARNLDYEHVGIPVCFTTHKGSIVGNHMMQVYSDALKAS